MELGKMLFFGKAVKSGKLCEKLQIRACVMLTLTRMFGLIRVNWARDAGKEFNAEGAEVIRR